MAGLVNTDPTPPAGQPETAAPRGPADPAEHTLSDEQAAAAGQSGGLHGSVRPRSLIRLLVALKWTLWKRSYRKNIGKLIGTIFGVLYGLGGLGGLTFAMLGLTLWAGEGETFPLVIQGLGVVTILAWLLIPVLALGVDDTLDARAFALFPRTPKELQPGMFAASAVSLPVVFTVLAVGVATGFEVLWLVLFGQDLLWIVLAMIVLVPANLAGVVLCLLLPRAVFAHSASRSSSRSGRELGGIVGMVVGLGGIYGLSLVAQQIGDFDLEVLAVWLLRAVEVATWTPFGAPFAIPMDLATGSVLPAIVRAAITGATIAAVWLWWRRSIGLALTSALTGDASSGEAKVTSLVPRFVRPTAFGAVLGRSLRYWRRDTRYLAAVGVMPLVIVFFALMGLFMEETRPIMLGMAVMMSGFASISISNEIGFDGPSGWVNITADLNPRANLLGRIVAQALLLLPLAIVLGVGLPLLYGYAELIPMVLLGALGLLATGSGLSMMLGTLVPYPTAPPGTNPMKDKSSSSGNAMLSMALASAGLFVPQLPAIGLAIWGAVVGSTALTLTAGALALVMGAIVFVVGLQVGTKRLAARYPDIFQKVRDFV